MSYQSLNTLPKTAYIQGSNNYQLVMMPVFGPYGVGGERELDTLNAGPQPLVCLRGPKILVTRITDNLSVVIDAVDWDAGVFTNPLMWDPTNNVSRGPWTPPAS